MVNVDEVTMSFGEGTKNVDLEIESIENEIDLDTSNTIAGTNNYKRLINQPSINNVILVDNKTSSDLKLQPEGNYPDETLSNSDIEELLNNFS